MFNKINIESKNITSLLIGRVSTNIADSLFYMTILWFFKSEFHSSIILSLIFVADSSIDMLAFLFGPLIDRAKIRKLLRNTSWLQFASSLLAICLFRINKFRFISIVLLTSIYIFSTIGSTLIYSTESKVLPVIVNRENLSKINGLFQMTYQTLDLFLDALATLFITLFSFSLTMIISALFFVVALTFYLQLHLKENAAKPSTDSFIKSYLHDLTTGWKTLRKQRQIFLLIVPFAATNLFYGVASVGLPYFSSDYLSKSAIGYGGIEFVSSIGGLIVGIFAYRISLKIELSKLVTICLFMAGFSVILEVIVANFSSALILIFTFSASFWIGLMNINFEVLMQESFDPSILGRIVTINSSIINCMIPLGSLMGGIIVKSFGANVAILTEGLAEVITALFYLVFFRKTE